MSVKSFSPLRNGCPRPIAPVSRSKTRRVAKLRFPCCCTSESPAPKLPPSNDSVVHRPLPKGGKPRLVTVFGRSTVLMSMVCPACGNQLNQLVELISTSRTNHRHQHCTPPENSYKPGFASLW